MRPDKRKTGVEQKGQKKPDATQKGSAEELDVLKTLVVDEKDVFKNLREEVERARSVFSIASPSGKVIFENFGDLSDYKRILVLLLGKYFAMRLGLVESAALGIREISEELGKPTTALSGDVGTLRKEGLVEKLPDRTYRIAYNRVREIFGVILPPKPPVGAKEIRPGVFVIDRPPQQDTMMNNVSDFWKKPKPKEGAPAQS